MLTLMNLINIATDVAWINWTSDVILNGPDQQKLSFRLTYDGSLGFVFTHVVYSKCSGDSVTKFNGRLLKVSPTELDAIFEKDDFIAWHYTKPDAIGIIWESRPGDISVIPKIDYSSCDWEPDPMLISQVHDMRLKTDKWMHELGQV